MAADDVAAGHRPIRSQSPSRWRTASFRASQFLLAILYLGGAILLATRSTGEAPTPHRRIFDVFMVGILFVMALAHLIILLLAPRRSKEADAPPEALARSTWSPFSSPEVRDIRGHDLALPQFQRDRPDLEIDLLDDAALAPQLRIKAAVDRGRTGVNGQRRKNFMERRRIARL